MKVGAMTIQMILANNEDRNANQRPLLGVNIFTAEASTPAKGAPAKQVRWKLTCIMYPEPN